MLEFDRVSVGYGDLTVVQDVSFRVDAGEVVSLVGSNGGTISNSYSTGPVTAGSGASMRTQMGPRSSKIAFPWLSVIESVAVAVGLFQRALILRPFCDIVASPEPIVRTLMYWSRRNVEVVSIVMTTLARTCVPVFLSISGVPPRQRKYAFSD